MQQSFGSGGGPFSSSDPMVQWGGQYGQQVVFDYGTRAFTEGEKSVSRWLSFLNLSTYFRVNNSYVLSKIGLILCPFGRKVSRLRSDMFDGDMSKGVVSATESVSPLDDVNAPDLYIPLMALTTYVVLTAFEQGLRTSSLAPNDLAQSFTAVIFWLTFEVIVVKIWRYIASIPQQYNFLDLVALCSYKYVGICLVVMLKSLFGSFLEPLIWNVVTFVVSCGSAYYVAFSLRDWYWRGDRVPAKVMPLVYGLGVLQILMYFWFCARPFSAV